MTSIVSQLMAPGGGVALIPFIRVVISCLLLITVTCFFAGVARIHMAILCFLSTGLLISLSMFEKEWDRLQKARSNRMGGDDTEPTSAPAPGTDESKPPEKTD
uniref:Uncharacterized protein n=1 Tax=Pseudictyota dubia TaxID=2749911 RepID=A0A7R9WAL4_9STRA|eukprot:CAMPEP_0197435640 /NCGR_PEP_ID=MMETSP1175-20131217/3206_1 /TAXON_ID=1003142 /ORGANISM="Triceratium dubium, Strain CCMP147" /LENGTH=102 /DNA_ID=CAMNT_0042964731 /DNA_START=117 /DNA_END=425 /DNA_ORIENTATION=-